VFGGEIEVGATNGRGEGRVETKANRQGHSRQPVETGKTGLLLFEGMKPMESIRLFAKERVFGIPWKRDGP